MNIYDNIHGNMPKEDLTNSFIAACHVGDLDAVKSLLENHEFEKHIDAHYNNEVAFQWIIFNQRTEVLQYLILEYKMNKTEEIEKYLIRYKKEGIIADAIRLFDTQELTEELTHNDNKSKKAKI